MSPSPIVVIGVGNPTRRDDGVGPAVLQQLREQGVGDDVELVTVDGEPTRLLEAWRGRQLAVVVDAMVSGVRPGRVLRIEVGRDPLPPWTSPTSSHGGGLAEAVALSRAVEALPELLVLLGADCVDVSHGHGLSPAVAAAVPELVSRVRAELDANAVSDRSG